MKTSCQDGVAAEERERTNGGVRATHSFTAGKRAVRETLEIIKKKKKDISFILHLFHFISCTNDCETHQNRFHIKLRGDSVSISLSRQIQRGFLSSALREARTEGKNTELVSPITLMFIWEYGKEHEEKEENEKEIFELWSFFFSSFQ